jgi:hypothetical protein
MLNSHSIVFVPDEIQILFEYSNNGIGLFEVFNEKMNENFSADDFVRLIEAKCPHNFHKYFDYKSFFESRQYPITDFKNLVNNLYCEIAQANNKKIFVDQTPWYGQRIDILNDLFPDAKYIHVVRDGRDVAISFARTPWWHDDISQNMERWNAEVGQILDSSAQILKKNQMLQVRYEDVVEQPEVELKHICNFLGIDFEDAMIDPATYIDYTKNSKLDDEMISSSNLNEWTKSKSTTTFKGSCYAWKNNTDFDFSDIPKHVVWRLKLLGYETQQPRFNVLINIYRILKKMGKKLKRLYRKGN